MKKNIRKIALSIVSLGAIFGIEISSARAEIFMPPCGMLGLPCNANGVEGVLSGFLGWLLATIGFLAIISFAISGILYFTAAGSEDQAKVAKRAMLYSVIGVIVVLSAFVIIQAIDLALKGRSSF